MPVSNVDDPMVVCEVNIGGFEIRWGKARGAAIMTKPRIDPTNIRIDKDGDYYTAEFRNCQPYNYTIWLNTGEPEEIASRLFVCPL